MTDAGVSFSLNKKKKVLLTPEKSIEFQALLKTDLMVVLDDFTPLRASRLEAEETVRRTVEWAKRSKAEFERIFKDKDKRPYLVAVVHGGSFMDLRKECSLRLAEIGFDGYGYGGWPLTVEGKFDYLSAKIIAENVQKDSWLYGLGIGKPDEITNLVKLGYNIMEKVIVFIRRKKKNTTTMTGRLIRTAIVFYAGNTAGPTCGICLKLKI